MKKLMHIAAGIALIAAAPLGAQDDPAALVLRIRGDVQVRHGGGAWANASVGERLMAGDEVLPGGGALAVLMSPGGGTQRVTEATTVAAPRGAGNTDMFVRALAALSQAASTDVSVGGRQGMIRPIPGATSLVSPRNGLTVQSDRPTFEWTPTPGKSYELMLRKTDGGRPEIFDVGDGTSWTYPDELPALEFGATYAWTVFVGGRSGGRPLLQQEFRVLDIPEFAQLSEFMEEIKEFGLDPLDDGLFLTVVVFRDLGLYYDAGDAIVDIEGQGDMSADMYMLKGEILNTLGREAEARAAFDKADALMR
jgi:hypothetical protein